MSKTDMIKCCNNCRWYNNNAGYYNFASQWLAPCEWDRTTAHIPDALKQGTNPYIERNSGINCVTWEAKDAKATSS